MFPRETTQTPARRSFAERLRDALGTAVEFATLGEATFDEQAPAKVRYLRPDEEAVPVQHERPSDDRPVAPKTREIRSPAPAAVSEHPHRLALRRPVRPRRPGAVRPLNPVCTMPVAPVPHRAADGVLPAPAAPFAHRHTGQD